MKRIGILTAGGDCPGLNAVIRAVAKTAMLEHDLEVVGIEDGFDGLINNRARNLSYFDVSGILTQGGTILGTSNKANPFSVPVHVGGKVIHQDLSNETAENFRRMELDVLVAIGGDGTMNIAHQMGEKGVPIIGVPKTIDNDLQCTDITFGYDTAMATATHAIDQLHTTAMSHHRVMICEVMGRYAGWIALGAGVAGGGDIILIPEIPYDIDAVCARARERHRLGKRFSLIVVAEGAKPAGGDMVVQQVIEDSPDPIRLGGIGQLLTHQIEEKTGLETRVTVLGHLQRGGSPTAFDRLLATRFGVEACRRAMAGESGIMVALKGSDITAVPIQDAIATLKLVSRDHELVQAARMVGTSFGEPE
ncbi:6-phosphofructokinase [candidate division KSB1 bacterium]